jgi:hypothetical protein
MVNKPKEVVWDFTQDYENRTKWDSSVLEAVVVQTIPNRIVKLKMKGNTHMTFIYKLDDRPNKTSLVAREVESSMIESGGGSWTYEDESGATIWSQTNTIVLKNNFLLTLSLPFLKWIPEGETRRAMNKGKKIMEQL